MTFAAAVKTSAINWPSHRGTATAFPLAAFGLSAFFFSFLGASLFPGDPSAFLKLLSIGTFSLTFVGFFFLNTYPHTSYHAISHDEGRRSSSLSTHLRPSTSRNPSLGVQSSEEPGTSTAGPVSTNVAPQSNPPLATSPFSTGNKNVDNDVEDDAVDETSSLMSSAASEIVENVVASSVDTDRSHRIDIRGLKLLQSQSFWLLFTIMTILSGVGLMTIKYVPLRELFRNILLSPRSSPGCQCHWTNAKFYLC
jgi:hypothetical protein